MTHRGQIPRGITSEQSQTKKWKNISCIGDQGWALVGAAVVCNKSTTMIVSSFNFQPSTPSKQKHITSLLPIDVLEVFQIFLY